MAIKSGTLGQFYSHGTVYTGFSDEVCTDLGENLHQIADTTMRWWRPESPITVSTASGTTSTEVAASAYTRRDLGGIVAFNAAIPGDSTVVVSGTYYPMSQVGGFRDWEFSMSRDMIDVSRQGSGGWEESVAGIASAEVSADGFWTDDYFANTVNPTVKWLVVCYVDQTAGARYEAQTYLTSYDVSTEYDGVAEESVSFQCTEVPRYYATNA